MFINQQLSSLNFHPAYIAINQQLCSLNFHPVYFAKEISCTLRLIFLFIIKKMAVLDLPNEIFLGIAENLESQRDLSSFTQTNTRLYHLLSDHLYENNIKRHGSSALLWAAYHGHEKPVRRLLAKGADANVPVAESEAVARVIEEKGGEPEYLAEWTPLMLAAENGHGAVVKLLLENGADSNSDADDSPLHLAAQNRHEAVVELLIENGANINSDCYLRTPLTLAAENGRKAVVRLLLDRGADVEDCYISALGAASLEGHKETVQMLLDWGADPNARAGHLYYKHPLIAASLGGHTEIVQLLLDRGGRHPC
jgi:ankyrin repeat protein